jgi:hypothetical protein
LGPGMPNIRCISVMVSILLTFGASLFIFKDNKYNR